MGSGFLALNIQPSLLSLKSSTRSASPTLVWRGGVFRRNSYGGLDNRRLSKTGCVKPHPSMEMSQSDGGCNCNDL